MRMCQICLIFGVKSDSDFNKISYCDYRYSYNSILFAKRIRREEKISFAKVQYSPYLF